MNIRKRLRRYLSKTPPHIKVRNPVSAFEMARKHFQEILVGHEANNLYFRIKPDSFIKLDRFIEMFGDLIEKGDYQRSSFIKRNIDHDLHFPNNFFDDLAKKGLLY